MQMGEIGNLVGAHGATAAGMIGPAEHSGFEEGPIDNQLTAPLKQIEQAYLSTGSVERVFFVYGHPWHPPAFGGQSVTGMGEGFLFRKELLACSAPLLLRNNRGSDLGQIPMHLFRVDGGHLVSPFIFGDR